ncbi:hypothetical protein KTH81_00160 [Lachnospiraceae bacterium ASD3451]|uniref:hypothetical protein n=1 Tax=Diplocloster agilis TaxID=2850323 RepID=UPI001D240D3A|nr:hypothetical protein [Diplocloster agilis]MBU9742217.1 hypothetical protein [Diplocloster agilis]
MGKVMILNASPRAPRSNSKRYAEIFSKYDPSGCEYYNITKSNHKDLCAKIEAFSDVLFVFPLYVDGIPSTLLQFLKTLEDHAPRSKPVISVLINCGFIEWEQNDVAISMIKLFCGQNGYAFGSALSIGSGEAILDTPFKFLADKKIKKLAASIDKQKYGSFHTAMPLTKRVYINASTDYWIRYGKKNGITREQMESMKIE